VCIDRLIPGVCRHYRCRCRFVCCLRYAREGNRMCIVRIAVAAHRRSSGGKSLGQPKQYKEKKNDQEQPKKKEKKEIQYSARKKRKSHPSFHFSLSFPHRSLTHLPTHPYSRVLKKNTSNHHDNATPPPPPPPPPFPLPSCDCRSLMYARKSASVGRCVMRGCFSAAARSSAVL
jgi:hypothetical protein